jgi:hypothetical protein
MHGSRRSGVSPLCLSLKSRCRAKDDCQKGVIMMSVRSMCACLLAASMIVALGCSRGPSRFVPPAIDASTAGALAIELYDANKDGKLCGAELEKCPALKAALAQIDTTRDGDITADKIAARIESWKKWNLGRISFTFLVLRNGKPLPNADVKFVPDKFLGNSVPTAEGKTNEQGVGTVSVTANGAVERPGSAPPGFYRVEITRAGDNIPPKYNADTILGQEVAYDGRGVQGGMKFELKY